jgi:rubredoxin
MSINLDKIRRKLNNGEVLGSVDLPDSLREQHYRNLGISHKADEEERKEEQQIHRIENGEDHTITNSPSDQNQNTDIYGTTDTSKKNIKPMEYLQPLTEFRYVRYCPMCGGGLVEEEFGNDVDTERHFKCKVCGFEFTSKMNMVKYRQIVNMVKYRQIVNMVKYRQIVNMVKYRQIVNMVKTIQ